MTFSSADPGKTVLAMRCEINAAVDMHEQLRERLRAARLALRCAGERYLARTETFSNCYLARNFAHRGVE